MKFKNKTIFIVSYEGWGGMLMSKHHYALTLAQMGCEVYFINHPDLKKELRKGEVLVIPTEYENLKYVKHRLLFPFFLKFKFKWLYYLLTLLHIKKIIKKIGKRPYLVWSFETGNALPPKYFGANFIIYMPVDGPFGTPFEKDATDKASVIISVTNDILEPFNDLPIPKYKIGHGVSDVFINESIVYKQSYPLRVGYSGSLIRSDLDMSVFTEIISEHSDVIFEFWGEINHQKSNIHLPQDVNQTTLEFIQYLKHQKNVILHGAVKPKELAAGLKRMDALLICYNIKNDHNNHHKVLEYFGAGSVIISSYMSFYKEIDPVMLVMAENDKNSAIPSIFANVIQNLSEYNSEEIRRKRIDLAKKFTYASQIERIEKLLLDSTIK